MYSSCNKQLYFSKSNLKGQLRILYFNSLNISTTYTTSIKKCNNWSAYSVKICSFVILALLFIGKEKGKPGSDQNRTKKVEFQRFYSYIFLFWWWLKRALSNIVHTNALVKPYTLTDQSFDNFVCLSQTLLRRSIGPCFRIQEEIGDLKSKLELAKSTIRKKTTFDKDKNSEPDIFFTSMIVFQCE